MYQAKYAFSESVNPVPLLVELIARSLVDNSAEVKLEVVEETDQTLIRLWTASSDVGKVIGKQGRTARAMRTILAGASLKLKHRYSLEIVEESPIRDNLRSDAQTCQLYNGESKELEKTEKLTVPRLSPVPRSANQDGRRQRTAAQGHRRS